METFAQIIGLWESAEELASDLGLPGNNPGVTVRAWRRRNSIPPRYWDGLVDTRKARAKGVTLETLAMIAAHRGHPSGLRTNTRQ